MTYIFLHTAMIGNKLGNFMQEIGSWGTISTKLQHHIHRALYLKYACFDPFRAFLGHFSENQRILSRFSPLHHKYIISTRQKAYGIHKGGSLKLKNEKKWARLCLGPGVGHGVAVGV